MKQMKLLTLGNTKTAKSVQFGYLTGILHLAPSKLSGYQVCPKASKGCIASCLNTSGKGGMTVVQAARKRRTLQYFNARPLFVAELKDDIRNLEVEAKKQGLLPAVRINGTSDIPTLAIEIAKAFPNIQFYDYTKIKKTLSRTDIPSNYHLTFSRSESNEDEALEVLAQGHNVAVVFDKLPSKYKGYKVHDGDNHDLRFLDPVGVVVGLKAKGKARKEASGFVVRGV